MDSLARLPNTTDEEATLFAAMSDPTRLKLLKLLQRQCDGNALCVNALAGLLGVSQSAVSQHLRVLKGIGLVKGARRGCQIHYFIKQDALSRCRELASAALSSREPEQGQLCTECRSERGKRDVSSL
jgi:ArsR family transcriptional regulator, arsenate/arsenite/antimonite-responsive transcriptional repressor